MNRFTILAKPFLLMLACWSTSFPSASLKMPIADYSLAAHLGSGVYAVGGAASQIYRASSSLCLLSPYTHRWGLRIRAAGAAGFYDYQLTDFFSEGFPRGINTFALFPTLEAEHLVGRNWLIAPFIGMGAGVEVNQRTHHWLAGGGLHNLFVFPLQKYDVRLNSRVLYCGLLNKSLQPFDDFSMIESGIEFRRPLDIELFGLPLDGSIFGINYLYRAGSNLSPVPNSAQLHITEWEVGVTLGTVETVCIWKVKLPRVGLSYRFGSEREGIRIIAGDSFPILSPRGEIIRRFNLMLHKLD